MLKPTKVLSPEEFIKTEFVALGDFVTLALTEFQEDMQILEVRMCLDGYPDMRFKETYGPEYDTARRLLTNIRAQYTQYVNNAQRQNLNIAYVDSLIKEEGA